MRWLGVGPYGNRADDIVLLARSGRTIPIEQRYCFSGPYRSWHGSPSEQESHIPLVLACQGKDGKDLHGLASRASDRESTLTTRCNSLARAILGKSE